MKRFFPRTMLLVMLVLASALTVAPRQSWAEDIALEDLPAECGGVTPTQPNRWIAVWNFHESSTGCMLHTGEPAVEGDTPPITSYELIACTTVGTVDIANSYAFFDGTGYFSCTFTADLQAAPGTHVEYPDFWSYSYLKLNSVVGAHPVFYHPSASMTIHRQSTGAMNLAWSFQHANQTVSTGVTPNFYSSAFDGLKIATSCDDVTCADPTSNTQSAYRNQVQLMSQTSEAPLSFNTGPTTIYIGYSPVTQAFLHGELGRLIIDPTDTPRDPIGD